MNACHRCGSRKTTVVVEDNEYSDEGPEFFVYVRCQNCGNIGPVVETSAEAVTAWNAAQVTP